METKVLKIVGMSCAHCQKAVTDALQGLSGVRSVQVDLGAGQATVAYDPAKVTVQAMKEAVAEAGYEVTQA